ncbi:RHS repeat domain-containing protein [Flavobacterium sp.]|uniref:RHS repeat domain-containing protein n=1 Tax=Flavobacterium sp. TaxID=239 RepID=UPI00263923A0|nr:RHS repeat domain-containing protein [Flavobacterium sp.]
MRILKIIAVLFFSNINAQSIKTPETLPTPNATSLGKYGDVPVSFYSGKANVTIPILSINENGIPLDITLDYDTGGVRVAELPSWVGQNWSLNAGGVIVRTMKGMAVDELKYEAPWPTVTAQEGYFYKRTILNVSNWSDVNYLNDINDDIDIRHDYEPDIFTFNFMGITGKFFLSHDGTWKVQSDKNIKVEINMADNVLALGRTTHCQNCSNNLQPPKVIGKITLTDDSGNKYIFGNNPNAIEYSNDDFFDYTRSLNRANAWYLTSVYDRYNNLVYSFTYERGEYIPSFYLSAFNRVYYSQGNGGLFNLDPDCQGSESNLTSLTKLLNGGLTMPVYLKNITSKHGYNISFDRSQSNYKYYTPQDEGNLLDNRMQEWYHYRNSLLASTGLNTSQYFTYDFYLLTHDINDLQYDLSTVTGYGTQFLLDKTKMYKLDKINVQIGSNTLKEINLLRNGVTTERLNLYGVEIKNGSNPSTSTYNFEYNNFNQLPNYISKAIDHWGYYKGTSFNYFTLGSNMDLHYNTRNPDPTYLQIGSLKKIIYPTKGYTEFEYEPHTYSNFINDNLAIQNESNIAGGLRVKKITNFDGLNANIKTYKYTESFSSNISSGILALKNKYYYTNWETTTAQGQHYREDRFSLNNLMHLSNFSGSHIGYSKVYEVEQMNGYKEYNYTDYNDYPDVPYVSTLSMSHSIFDAKISNDFKRGKLKKTSYFNNSSELLKEQLNTYQSIGNHKARAYNYSNIRPCWADYILVGNTYEIEYSDFSLLSTEEKDYLNGNTISNIMNYQYSNFPNDSSFFGDSFLVEEKRFNSLNEEIKTLYYYPFNSINHSQLLSSRFMPNVATETYNNNVKVGKKEITFMPFTVNNLSYFLPAFDLVTKEQNVSFKNIEIDSYDNNGNIKEFHQPNGISTSLFWSNGKLLTKVVGATQAQITSQGISTLAQNPTVQVTSYIYNSFNDLIKITHPNGDFENYFYDSANRLERITDRNNNLIKKYLYNLKN